MLPEPSESRSRVETSRADDVEEMDLEMKR